MRLTGKLALCLTVALLCGCSGGSSSSGGTFGSSSRADETHTLHVLAGSEVKDLEPLLPDLEKQTGVHLDLQYSGTLAGIDRIESQPASTDAVWFSQDKYFVLTDRAHLIKASTKIMLSPVVMGVKRSKVQELGWAGKPITWKQIESAVAAGKLRYAMTNPASSNSGFAAVVSVASALSGNADALRSSDVSKAKLTGFFSGQKLIAGSSGWLADAYVKSQDDLDGIINYESVLIGLNKGGQLHEPLTLLYPKDGVLTADYPLVLVAKDKQALYDKVVAYLRTPAVQRQIMNQTYRRPVLASVPLSPAIPHSLLVDTPFPGSRAAVDSILLAYLNVHRVAGHSYFVLDTSGSMEGSRLDSVKRAIHILAGGDNSLTGKFAKFEDREQITMEDFSGSIKHHADFTMHSANDPQTLSQVTSFADALSAGGGTAIYSALDEALQEAQHDPPSRYATIVLMTDGENNQGESSDDFAAHFNAAQRKVRIFPVLVGEASPSELQQIADLTGGRVFDARTTPLPEIFKEIRGYQ